MSVYIYGCLGYFRYTPSLASAELFKKTIAALRPTHTHIGILQAISGLTSLTWWLSRLRKSS